MNLIFLALLALLPLSATAGVVLTDDTGREVVLPRPAMRIVSLAPHLTELAFAAGAGARVVGAVAHSDYPPAAHDIPRVGNYDNLDLERILALRPDLILAWASGNPPRQLERLRGLGIPLFVNEPRRLEEIADTLERIGQMSGSEPIAKAAAERFRGRLGELARRYRGAAPVRVFYEVWNEPLMTVNGEHIISRVIELCGGENVFARLPLIAPQVGLEAVLEADPEVIVASGMGEERPEWLDEWRRWPRLRAVAAGNLFFVPPDLLQRHTPRLLDGAQRLCAQLDRARRRRGAEAAQGR